VAKGEAAARAPCPALFLYEPHAPPSIVDPWASGSCCSAAPSAGYERGQIVGSVQRSVAYDPTMQSADEVKAKLRDVLSARADAEGLAAAYLFGSLARGSARPDSDVDVGVLYVDAPPPGLEGLGFHLEADLERLLGRPVHLTVLNRAPVDLAQRVLRDGCLLLDRDHSRRVRFEVRTRQEFWDLEPFLRRYRRTAEDPRP